MARLRVSVHVDGRWYRPGETVPDEVARQIRNPKVWEPGHAPTFDEAVAPEDGGEVPDHPVEESRPANKKATSRRGSSSRK